MEKENENIRIIKSLIRDLGEKISKMQKEIDEIKGKIGAVFTKVYDKKEE